MPMSGGNKVQRGMLIDDVFDRCLYTSAVMTRKYMPNVGGSSLRKSFVCDCVKQCEWKASGGKDRAHKPACIPLRPEGFSNLQSSTTL